MSDEPETPEAELFRRLSAMDGTIVWHKNIVMEHVLYYAWQVSRREAHKIVNLQTALDLVKEAAASCPHHPCKIREEV